jgi:hypothetical protein
MPTSRLVHMKRRTAATLLFAITLALRSGQAQQVTKGDWTIFLQRADRIRFGMSLSEVRRVIGDSGASLYVSDPDNPLGDRGCTYLESARLPEHLGFMFDNRRVVRVDVSSRSVAQTASGARVGDTEERIKALYPGRIRVEPHKYDPETGHYLFFVPKDSSDKGHEIVFETDGKRVTQFRVGFSSAKALVEGCS